jgi:hypothetical protein
MSTKEDYATPISGTQANYPKLITPNANLISIIVSKSALELVLPKHERSSHETSTIHDDVDMRNIGPRVDSFGSLTHSRK